MRSSVEIVDAFAVAYLLLPKLFPEYVPWCSRVLERYQHHVDTSMDTFLKAKILNGASSYEALIAQIHELHMIHLCCPVVADFDNMAQLLKHWMAFLTSAFVTAKWV